MRSNFCRIVNCFGYIFACLIFAHRTFSTFGNFFGMRYIKSTKACGIELIRKILINAFYQYKLISISKKVNHLLLGNVHTLYAKPNRNVELIILIK